MKVKKLIKILKKFDPELEVIISDGRRCHFYNTKNIEIQEFKETDKKILLDIGIGDSEEYDELTNILNG